MPLIEAALAFAITMLALSLVVSSFVEIIHRTFKLREAGLKYMLEQLFDQVLAKYVEPLAQRELTNNPALSGKALPDAYVALRKGFVERMTANRSPVGLKPDSTLAVAPLTGTNKPRLQVGNLWGGRRVTQLSPTDFMERLGSSDVGEQIATAGGQVAADRLDDVLKDIAQKFDGFGKDAASYFEGRARMMSVFVAIALAFAVHVDAVDLFRTYLRDPNARTKVIEQSQALTAQFKASQEAIGALDKLVPKPVAKPSPTRANEGKSSGGQERNAALCPAQQCPTLVVLAAPLREKCKPEDGDQARNGAPCKSTKETMDAPADPVVTPAVAPAPADEKSKGTRPEEAKKVEPPRKAGRCRSVREAKATPNKPAPKPAAAPPPTEDIKSEGPKPDDAKKGEPAKNAECEAAQGATAIAVEIVPTPAPVLPLAEEQKPEGSNPDEVKPEADKKAEQPKNAEKTENADEAKKQVEALQKDTLAALADANATVKQFADLGIPLGWNDDRLKAARVTALLWTCSELPKGATERYGTWQQACKSDEDGYKGPKGQQFENVYLEVPLSPNAWFYLLLGGLLIGLGSPFWYDVVTGLTTLRNAAGGKTATAPPPQPGAGPPAAEAAKAQPVTPVGAFQVSNAAAILATGRAAAAEDRNSAASPRAPGTEDGSDEAE